MDRIATDENQEYLETNMVSLSRQLAQWVVGLRYEDLTPAVLDRAKESLYTVSHRCFSAPKPPAAGKQYNSSEQKRMELMSGRRLWSMAAK